MLAKVENYNIEAKEIKKEGREKLCLKMRCKEKAHKMAGMKILAGCERLWLKKTKGNTEQGTEDEDEGYEFGCRDDIEDEEIEQKMKEYENNPEMELDGEEMQIVMECDGCGPSMTEYLLHDCEGYGTSWVREDFSLTLVGNDVVSLFPSMESENTGRIVREEVEKSTISF